MGSVGSASPGPPLPGRVLAGAVLSLFQPRAAVEACRCYSRELVGWGLVLPTRLQSGGFQVLETSKQLSVAGFVTLEQTHEMKGPKQRGSLPSLVRILGAEQAIF